MNKVITINLNGNAFQLEEGGYDALRLYLEGAARRLEANPDRDEIIADIEQAIADKCRAVLGTYKTVVETREITRIIDEMGPVEDTASEAAQSGSGVAGAGSAEASGSGGQAGAGAAGTETKPPLIHRLYRIRDGGMIAGVCNGIAAFIGLDVTVVRLAFVLLSVFTLGAGLVAYAVLAFVVPPAETTAEKAAACGTAFTAREFIHRARDGYYEGMRTFGDRQAHRAWRRQFKREMRGWRRMFRQEMRTGISPWPQPWVPGPGAGLVLWIVFPILSILRAGLALIAFFVFLSLVTTGAGFGVPLPAGVPVWIAVLVLLVVYNLVAWPLKAMRHAWCYHAFCGQRYAPPVFWLADTVVWLAFVVVMVWLADHYVPHVHEALCNLFPAIHHAMETMKQWWAAR
jgi:phage shock protein PspC (stress-responsive transcriptional regulator)